MRALPLPLSGPITLDCREQSPTATLRNLEDTLRRMRAGPRLLVVRVARPDQIDVVSRWARGGRAPHQVVATARGPEVRVYLLPINLGGHPSQAFYQQRPIDLAALSADRPLDPQPVA